MGSTLNFPGVKVENGPEKKLIIANKDEYITALAKVYKKANPDLPLNDRTKQIISDSIDKNNVYTLPNNLPGIHAEVRTYNAITTYNPTVSNSQITIATVRGEKKQTLVMHSQHAPPVLAFYQRKFIYQLVQLH